MAKPVRLGVVGAGSIALRAPLIHLSFGDLKEQVVSQAVCDPVPGRAKAAAEKFGVPYHSESYDDLLAKGDCDAVTICSPIGLHYEQGMKALNAGKHIHFNKTMTTTKAEADELIALAKKKNLRIVASPGQMIRPHNQLIKKMIKDGALGKLAWAVTGAGFGDYHQHESVRSGNDVLTNIDPSWYFRKPGGGPLYDMTVYGLHAMTGVLGPAKRVTALSGVLLKEREFRGKPVPCDCDDNTLIAVDFGNSGFAMVYGTATGTIEPAWGSPTYFGTKGRIDGNKLNGKVLDYPGNDQDAQNILPHVTAPHKGKGEEHVYEDVMQLVDWIREGKPSVASAEHARHVVDLIESAYRSAATGKAQELTTTFDY